MKRVETMMPVERFIADDGTMFKTKEECENYEVFNFMKEHINIFNNSCKKLNFLTEEEFYEIIKNLTIYVSFDNEKAMAIFNKLCRNRTYLSNEPCWDEENISNNGKNIWYKYSNDCFWGNLIVDCNELKNNLDNFTNICNTISEE